MKKIKKRKVVTVREAWIRLVDAELCPICGSPFPVSMQFKDGRIFICFVCERYFDKRDNRLVDITDEACPKECEHEREHA